MPLDRHREQLGVGTPRVGVWVLHGLADSWLTWRAVDEHLALTHHVIAPDMLGHGGSAKPLGDYSLGAIASGPLEQDHNVVETRLFQVSGLLNSLASGVVEGGVDCS